MDDNVLNTPGLMDPGTEFGNMMQTAMKIKGHQMEQDRKKFETWPQFFQNSMWMKGPALELRELPAAERLAGATKLKEAGNDLFKQKRYTEAVEQYEQAVGSFKWAKQLDEDWKKKGIRDETIEVIEDLGEGEARAGTVALLVSCYNNLAACYLGRARDGAKEPGLTVDGEFALCIQACDAALELQPGGAKALYRRACAQTEPVRPRRESSTSLARLERFWHAEEGPTVPGAHARQIREGCAPHKRVAQGLGPLWPRRSRRAKAPSTTRSATWRSRRSTRPRTRRCARCSPSCGRGARGRRRRTPRPTRGSSAGAGRHVERARCVVPQLLTRSPSSGSLWLRAALHTPEEPPRHGACSQRLWRCLKLFRLADLRRSRPAGEIYDAKSLKAEEARSKAEEAKAKASDKARTPEDCEREAKEAEAVVAHLREQGKLAEAAQLEGKISDHRAQLNDYKKSHDQARQKPDPRNVDFRNPTEEQVRDAQKHGIDLRDPMVVAELERLQKEKMSEEGAGGDDDASPPRSSKSDAAAQRSRARRRRPPPPDVHGMPLWEIKRRLDEMGVEYNDIDSDRPALEQRLMAQYSFTRRREDDLEDEGYIDEEMPGSWIGSMWSYCTLL